MSSAKSYHVDLNSKSSELPRHNTAMTFLNRDNNLGLVTLPSPSPSAESAKLASKLEALKEVQKLCEFHENSNKPSNDPKNLLENLCDGLETLLGFNSTSKGYTGQGIVYSDLDRLCDGVMAFLSGVLKDVSEKQPYSLGKETLKTLVSDVINNHLCSGHEGFKRLFDVLPASIAAYNSEVRQGNEKVKSVLRNYQLDLKAYKSADLAITLPNKIDPQRPTASTQESVEKVKSLVEQYTKLSTKFANSIEIKTKTDATKDAIKDLNPKLRDIIENVRSTVRYDSERLKELSSKEHDDLKATEDKIKKTLSSLKVNVDCRIDAQMKELIRNINERVKKISDELNEINKKLIDYVNDLYEWVVEAEKVLDAALEKVQIILSEVNVVASDKKPSEIIAVAEQIGRDIKQLHNGGKFVKDSIQSWVDTATGEAKQLHGWKTAAGSVVSAAKLKCETIGGMVKTKGATNDKIHGLANEMQTKADKLRVAAGHIKDNIQRWVGSATSAVGQLEEAVKGELKGLKGRIKSDIWERVENFQTAFAAGINQANYYKSVGHSAAGFGALKSALQSCGLNALSALLEKAGSDVSPFGTKIESVLHALKGKSLDSQPVVTEIRTMLTSKIDEQLPDDGMRKVQLTHLTTSFTKSNGGTDKSKKGELKDAISTIETNVNEKLKTNVEVKQIIDEQGTFETPFTQITAQLQKIAGLVDSDTKEGAALADGQKDGVNNYLGDLEEMLKEHSSVTFKSKITPPPRSVQGLEKIKQDITTALTKIQTDVTTNLGEFDTFNERSLNYFTEITSKLKLLCGDIKAQADDKDGLMKVLTDFKKENILGDTKKQLKRIHNDLSTLQGSLADGPIELTKKLLKFTSDAEKHFTKILKEEVHKDIKDAVIHLTSHARWQYVDSIKFLLQACADKVREDVKPLSKLIDTDLTIAFKGFMKVVEGAVTEGKTTGQNIEKLSSVASHPVDSAEKKKEAFKKLSDNFKTFYNNLHFYVNKQILKVYNDEEKKNPAGTPAHDYTRKFSTIYDALNELLIHLNHNSRFDCHVPTLLDSISGALVDLKPQDFATVTTPVLDVMVSGVGKYVDELRKVYISRYDRQTFEGELVKNPNADNSALTKEGRDCAKTFLTLLAILNDDLSYLRDQCNSEWSKRKLYSGSSLGSFLRRCGYHVAVKESDQNGELQNKTDFTGSSIHRRLVGENYDHVYRNDKDTKFSLENMYAYLNLYYAVCHIAASLSTRRPCSIYEMLGWLTSLVHHPVYFQLTTNDFADLFDKPKKKAGDNAAVDDITFEEPGSLLLNAYPQNLTPSDLHDALVHVIGTAPMILTTIVGYGDEFTTYAVDYHSNAAGFAIPSSASSCLSMLLELMRRLFPVFRFLHSRCSNLSSEYGWYHCAYGSDVESAGWQCKDHSKTNVDCLPRSPLMSYLRDSLPGHLPHQLTSVDCKSECKTCPKSTPGMPCITPLGFKGFSGSKRTGKDISNVLTKFFDKGVASCLLSLSPRPPISLPEHYAFALSFVKGWLHNGGNGLKTKIESTMQKASIDLYSDASPLTNALRNAYGEARSSHGTNHPKTSEAAISSLSISTRCNGANHCGPYLSTLYSDTYPYFGNKHCNAYMSWSVYLPWTFWQQLNSLYNSFLQIFCQDWGCAGCLRGDTCKKGAHGMLNPDVPGDGCKCSSIVGCKGVGPTLYQYGFTFQDVHCLISSRANCFNLRNQLCSVLHSQYFKDLFEKCDEFLWIIRQPFSYLVLALWLLSFLYLLHIMVIRLDLLHIKSHLHSPSSHRIAAQSLLAAARVNKLGRVFYLQP